MKRILFAFLIILSFTYSSCTRYLMPSIVGADVAYKPRPMVADSTKTMLNLTAGISGTGGLHDEGASTTALLNINRGHTYKNFNFSYGLSGYLGKVEKAYITSSKSDHILPEFNKSTAGLGLQTSIGYHITSDRGNTDFRIINWENSFTREFGEFASFRNSLFGDLTYKNLIVSRADRLWTTGISSEIIFHHRKNKEFKHAFKLFIGGSPNLKRSFDNEIKTANNNTISSSDLNRGSFQFTYFLKIKKFNLTTQVDFSHFSSSFGLGYTL